MKNRVIYFVRRPEGLVTRKAFAVREESLPEVGPKQILVRSVYASVDPYMRGRMSLGKSYTSPMAVDTPMVGAMVGRVSESHTDQVPVGSWVAGTWAWADYAAVDAEAVRLLEPDLPPSAALHVLGMTGLTAYIGLTQFGHPAPGEQLVVSAAAGSVGSLVGQIGRLLGCRVVGVAGGSEKCAWLTQSLGFHAVADYKADDFARQLAQALPDGVDIYFDNVGGAVTDLVMAHLNPWARIVICGQIALYNAPSPPPERPRFTDLLINRAQATGFIVGEHQAQFASARAQLAEWYRAGVLHGEETVVDGFEHWIDAFLGLFTGANRGKTLVRLSPE